MALNRDRIFECGSIIFVWYPGVVGVTTLLRDYRILVVLEGGGVGVFVPWNLVSASSARKTAAEKKSSKVVFKMKLSHCEQNIRPVFGSAPKSIVRPQLG